MLCSIAVLLGQGFPTTWLQLGTGLRSLQSFRKAQTHALFSLLCVGLFHTFATVILLVATETAGGKVYVCMHTCACTGACWKTPPPCWAMGAWGEKHCQAMERKRLSTIYWSKPVEDYYRIKTSILKSLLFFSGLIKRSPVLAFVPCEAFSALPGMKPVHQIYCCAIRQGEKLKASPPPSGIVELKLLSFLTISCVVWDSWASSAERAAHSPGLSFSTFE